MHILEQRTIQNDRQHIFKPKRGTQTALAIIYESIATSKANKHNIDILHEMWAEHLTKYGKV